MGDLEERILRVLEDGERWESAQVLFRLRQILDRGVGQDEYDAAIGRLREKRLVSLDPQQRLMRRIEPDFAESRLEPDVERFLQSDHALEHLNIRADQFVFQKTTQGGKHIGTWSQPDFMLAAIRSWKYDPRRYLDVFSFELKTRAGAGVIGVYEAHAHGRFAHFPYLVCPRFRLQPQAQHTIERECAAAGVGLLQFDLNVGDDRGPHLTNIAFVLPSERRSPDPQRVEDHLEARLNADKLSDLKRMAQGA